ncbi:MAG: glycosyltransferase [Sphingomonas sp.]|uniref:glycosyltransferase n=1 Tax=Sphingomonas sp. TaxID=28214 RepID=UPI001AC29EA6|nr:glycosyltransferase [Sphingomonas sp.]MBN8806911.1 glycosyltransferase [Sphingomonas sp.]
MVFDNRPVILTLLGVFQPGFDATGPNQSLLRMVDALSDLFRFRIVSMRLGSEPTGQWTTLHGVDRIALSRDAFGATGLRRLLATTPYDLLVSNGMFDMELTVPALVQRRLGLIPRRPMMVAPRGEFSPGAFALKHGRKSLFLKVARFGGLLTDVAIQATTLEEGEYLRRALIGTGPILLGPNIRPLAPMPPRGDEIAGGRLRVAFLSRIDRKKNLTLALDILGRAGIPIDFDIYGPVTDEAYWTECKVAIAGAPPTLSVNVHGAIAQNNVVATLAGADLFLLPTMGENFGHAIVDAMSAGTPVLLSDQTPWRGLATNGIGWDIPLDRPQDFVVAVRVLANSSPTDRAAQRQRVRSYIERRLNPAEDTAALAKCLFEAMGRSQSVGDAG